MRSAGMCDCRLVRERIGSGHQCLRLSNKSSVAVTPTSRVSQIVSGFPQAHLYLNEFAGLGAPFSRTSTIIEKLEFSSRYLLILHPRLVAKPSHMDQRSFFAEEYADVYCLKIKDHFEALTETQKCYAHWMSRYQNHNPGARYALKLTSIELPLKAPVSSLDRTAPKARPYLTF